MAQADHKESSDFIRDDLRLKTLPVAVKFLKETAAFPEKTRQPSVVLGKRVTICQGVTMARTYGVDRGAHPGRFDLCSRDDRFWF